MIPSKQHMFLNLTELKEYLDTQVHSKVKIFHSIVEPTKQKGQTCKLNAIANLLNYYFNIGLISEKPLPVNKNCKYIRFFNEPQLDLASVSIRKIAKQAAGSSVGEIYNLDSIKKLMQDLGKYSHDQSLENAQVSLEHYYADNSDTAITDYINRIKNLVDKGKTPPIIFFDVDKEGFPCKIRATVNMPSWF